MNIPTKAELLSLPPEYLAQWTGERLINANIAFIVITTVVFTLFIRSRLLHEVRNGWEFWTLYPLAYLCVIGTSIIAILMVKFGGVGRHLAYHLLHDPSVIEKYSQLVLATEFVYMAAITLPKIALLSLYLKIFVDQKIRFITWVVVGVVIAHWVSGFIVALTLCRPFKFYWDKTIKGGYCADQLAAYRYISTPGILTDLAILILPLPTLHRLQGIITAILRFVEFFTNDLMSDPTYVAVNTQTYCVVEPMAYFICSCLPGLRPLMAKAYQMSGLSPVFSSSFKSGLHHGRAETPPRTIPLDSLKNENVVIGVSDSFRNDDDEERLWFGQMNRSSQVAVSPSLERKDSAAEQDPVASGETQVIG